MRGKKVLNDVVNVCSKVVGKKQDVCKICMKDDWSERLSR